MNRRKKLLIVSPSLSHGGAERFVSSLVCGIDRECFEPHVCLLRDEVSYPLPDDVPITVLEKHRAWHIPRTITRLRQTLRSIKPDIALGNITFTSCLLAAATPGDCKAKLIARFGCPPRHEYRLTQRLLTWRIARHLLLGCESWVANSIQLAACVRQFYRCPRQSISAIYNPIDLSSMDPSFTSHEDANPLVVTAGRLEKEKRFDLLLESFAIVRKSVQARLRICGSGTLLESLKRQANALGIGGDVEFTGFQSDISPYMRAADLFVLTSDYEGMPNALLEAQALGLPAVSTDCETGPTEIILDGETGFLVPRRDVNSIADRMLSLLRDRELRREMGTQAAIRVRHMFDPQQTIRQWETLFDPAREDVECVA